MNTPDKADGGVGIKKVLATKTPPGLSTRLISATCVTQTCAIIYRDTFILLDTPTDSWKKIDNNQQPVLATPCKEWFTIQSLSCLYILITWLSVVEDGNKLTEVVGWGQQWMAAPACTASNDIVLKGNLATSALTSATLLQQKRHEKGVLESILVWVRVRLHPSTIGDQTSYVDPGSTWTATTR